jgi:hypothetical protein
MVPQDVVPFYWLSGMCVTKEGRSALQINLFLWRLLIGRRVRFVEPRGKFLSYIDFCRCELFLSCSSGSERLGKDSVSQINEIRTNNQGVGT